MHTILFLSPLLLLYGWHVSLKQGRVKRGRCREKPLSFEYEWPLPSVYDTLFICCLYIFVSLIIVWHWILFIFQVSFDYIWMWNGINRFATIYVPSGWDVHETNPCSLCEQRFTPSNIWTTVYSMFISVAQWRQSARAGGMNRTEQNSWCTEQPLSE